LVKTVRTYPLFREDGSLFAFEVTSAWISFRPLFKALRSVPGITNLKRNYFNEDRASFVYRGERWVVNEPSGDNSRYWIGPERGRDSALDATPVHEALQKLESFRYRLWRRLSRPEGA
jgi:hypothetical protein